MWIQLPQRFENSPTLFDENLRAGLIDFRQNYPQSTLLQYTDDLPIALTTEEECRQTTEGFLQILQALQCSQKRLRCASLMSSTWAVQPNGKVSHDVVSPHAHNEKTSMGILAAVGGGWILLAMDNGIC